VAWHLFVYMNCTTAVSNAGNISSIQRSIGSLPGCSGIAPVLVVVMPCVLGLGAGPGLCWASRAAVRGRSTMLISTFAVFCLIVPECLLWAVGLSG
jgi:hypothetical protein